MAKGPVMGGGLFKKKADAPVVEYLKKIEDSCFVCQRVEKVFERYIATIFYLYEKEGDFREKLSKNQWIALGIILVALALLNL